MCVHNPYKCVIDWQKQGTKRSRAWISYLRFLCCYDQNCIEIRIYMRSHVTVPLLAMDLNVPSFAKFNGYDRNKN